MKPWTKVTKLELLKGKLEKNKGHSVKIHRERALSETGLLKRCYRCELLIEIGKIENPGAA